MENTKNDQAFTVWAIIITLVIIAGTAYFVMRRSTGSSAGQDLAAVPTDNTAPATAPSAANPTTPAAAQAVDIAKVNTAGEPFVGSAKAPVTIAVWLDYQCPFCKSLDESVLSSVMSDYVNSGKVKIIYKDFVFLGPDSQTAALIGRAVWEAAPTKFYDWNSAMFAHQDSENSGWGSQADILALTKTISGIDEAKVEKLLAANSAKYQQAIDADKAEGSAFGISGTPATIIGQQLIVGAQPYSAIKPVIDAEVAKQ
jgi:protein-disulfide isomerase